MKGHRPKRPTGIPGLKPNPILERATEVNKKVDALLRENAKRVKSKGKKKARKPSAIRKADDVNARIELFLNNPDVIPSGLVKKKKGRK